MMRVYTVMDRLVPAGDDPDLVLVKEGICWPALVIPVIWMLFRGQWLALLAYATLGLALASAAALFGLHEILQSFLAVGLNLLVAVTANDWRRWRLEAAGYVMRGVVAAPNPAEAEARLFAADWLPAYRARQAAGSRPATSFLDPRTMLP